MVFCAIAGVANKAATAVRVAAFARTCIFRILPLTSFIEILS
jgi:hypothetical protein